MSFDAVVFPGQGSQKPGMGLDFLAESPQARAIFAAAELALGLDVAEICRGDPCLDLTEYTQPCVLTVEIAMWEALKARHELSPRRFGGHSLGEYAALVAAGALPFATAVRLVRRRGELMQFAVPPGAGKMAAVIMPKLPLEEIRALAAKEDVDVANDNSADQVVLSGEAAALERALARLKPYEARELRVVPLNVSAPFHSRHMAVLESQFRAVLEGVRTDFLPLKARAVTSNWTGAFHTGDADALLESLTRQLSATVRWRHNMAALLGQGGAILELGPSSPLRGFFQTAGAAISSVTDLRTAARAFRAKEVAKHDPV